MTPEPSEAPQAPARRAEQDSHMTPDRPGAWLFHPYPWTGLPSERVQIDFRIEGDKMILFPTSPRFPKTLEEMEKLVVWDGPPTPSL